MIYHDNFLKLYPLGIYSWNLRLISFLDTIHRVSWKYKLFSMLRNKVCNAKIIKTRSYTKPGIKHPWRGRFKNKWHCYRKEISGSAWNSHYTYARRPDPAVERQKLRGLMKVLTYDLIRLQVMLAWLKALPGRVIWHLSRVANNIWVVPEAFRICPKAFAPT